MLLVDKGLFVGEGVLQKRILKSVFRIGRTAQGIKADAPDGIAVARHGLLYVVSGPHRSGTA